MTLKYRPFVQLTQDEKKTFGQWQLEDIKWAESIRQNQMDSNQHLNELVTDHMRSNADHWWKSH